MDLDLEGWKDRAQSGRQIVTRKLTHDLRLFRTYQNFHHSQSRHSSRKARRSTGMAESEHALPAPWGQKYMIYPRIIADGLSQCFRKTVPLPSNSQYDGSGTIEEFRAQHVCHRIRRWARKQAEQIAWLFHTVGNATNR